MRERSFEILSATFIKCLLKIDILVPKTFGSSPDNINISQNWGKANIRNFRKPAFLLKEVKVYGIILCVERQKRRCIKEQMYGRHGRECRYAEIRYYNCRWNFVPGRLFFL